MKIIFFKLHKQGIMIDENESKTIDFGPQTPVKIVGMQMGAFHRMRA
jgi:hypothetical protein